MFWEVQLNEQILKDYNGQTYWFSANVHSFFKNQKFQNGLMLLLVMEPKE